MDQWIFYIVSVVVTLTNGIIGFFTKRHINAQDAENKAIRENQEKINASIRRDFAENMNKIQEVSLRQFEVQDKRIENLEKSHNQLVKDLPAVYAYREDLLRMSADTNTRLDKIQDMLVDLIRKDGGRNG